MSDHDQDHPKGSLATSFPWSLITCEDGSPSPSNPADEAGPCWIGWTSWARLWRCIESDDPGPAARHAVHTGGRRVEPAPAAPSDGPLVRRTSPLAILLRLAATWEDDCYWTNRTGA